MKRLIYLFFVSGILSLSSLYAQVITHNPKVEEQSAPYVTITRVELTNAHTIIDLVFKNPKSQPSTNFPFQFPRSPQNNSSQIWLDPNTRLYKPGEIDTKFKFVKAEGIPTHDRRNVTSGEEVAFRAYFERLTPGIEVFDFYEGRSDGRGQTWNFYGIHIKNPLKVPSQKQEVDMAAVQPIEKIEQKEPSTTEQPVAVVSDWTTLNGSVIDEQSKQPLKATIAYQSGADSISLATSSGKYVMALSNKQSYSLQVSSPGYLPKTVEVSATELAKGPVLEKEILLTPLEEGTSFVLDNIYFETSEFKLLQESFKALDELVATMKSSPSMRIRVEGHTDSVGDFDKNLELSKKRAQAVKEYLVEKGIDSQRIETQGYGQTRPVTNAKSEEEKSKNRRVEIVILKS